MRIIALDFEASCLPKHGRSYPIELGIADEQGFSRSWLIQPPEDWALWDWTREAEDLHGITKAQLAREGLSPRHVLAELEKHLVGARVVADSYLDGGWLATLSHAADRRPPCDVGHVGVLLEELGARYEDVEMALDALGQRTFLRHRAADDARYIIALLSEVRHRIAGRVISMNRAAALTADLPGSGGRLDAAARIEVRQ